MRNGFNWKQALVGLVSLCATSVFANGSPPPIVIVLNTVVQLTANKSVAAKDEPIVFSGIVTIKGGGQLQSGCAGTIALKDSDGSAVASTSLAGNCTYSLAVTSLKVGLHGVTASFGGGGGMEPSQSPSNSVSVRIIGLADPHITLSASENATFAKSKATVFATFANDYTGIPSPTGVVTFMDGTTVLGTAKVSNFVAQLPISLDTGSHSITAQYAGDTQYATATTAGLTVATNTNTTPMNWMFGYDAMNRRNNVVDPNGNQSYTYYDFPGRKVQEVTAANSANQAVVDYTYNDADALTNVKDPRSLSTAYTVDGLGQAKSQVSPDSGTTSYTYDVAGRVLSKTDARGKVASYTYDGLGRLLTVSYNGVQAVVLEYDGGALKTPEAKGKLTKVSDATGSTSYVYDIYGRVVQRTKVIGAKSFVTAMTYGTSGPSLGQVTSVTYPSGNVVNYTYAADGALNAITVTPVQSNGSSGVGVTTARSLLSQLTLDASGRVGGYYQGGAFTMVNYDNYGRLSSYNLGDAYAFPVSNGVIRTIGYDAGGRITSYTHTKDGVNVPELNQSFVYDKQSRLTSTTVGTVTTQYSYDATGNRTSKVINGVTYTNTISASSNRQVSVQDVGGTFNVTYDAAGNVVSDGVNTYTYNDKGRMVSATTSSGAVTNQYDAFDLRVAKTAAGVTTYYVYDDTGVLIGEYDANGAMVTESVYLDGGTPVSLLKHSGNAASNTLTVDLYNVHADHLGAPRIVTRQSDNKMVWRWDSAESYGGSAPNEDPIGLGTFVYNQRFPGQVFDKETGLFQNWHRDYNPRIGRYMQSDPIGLEGGINTYEYVAGSPTMFVDPTGFFSWSAGGLNDTSVTSYSYTNSDGSRVNYGGVGLFNSYGGSNNGGSNSAAGDNANVTVAGQLISAAPEDQSIWNGVSTYRAPTFQYEGSSLAVGAVITQNGAYVPVNSRSDAIEPVYLEAYWPGTKVLSSGLAIIKSIIGILESRAGLAAAKGVLPSTGGVVRQFEQVGDKVYYRVFSGDANVGGWLTSVPPKSSAWAQEALALPPGNSASMIQQVLVPNGTLLERSRAIPMPGWGRMRGGAEQFKLLDQIPMKNFGPGVPLP